MNERFRELVRQAGLDDADFPVENWDNVPLAKFAELIVRECGQVVSVEIEENCKPREEWGRDDWEQGYVSGMLAATRFMKAHFGINEWN